MSPPLDLWLMRPENVRRYYKRLGIEYVELDDWGKAAAVDVSAEAAKRKPVKGSQAAKDQMTRVRAAKETKNAEAK